MWACGAHTPENSTPQLEMNSKKNEGSGRLGEESAGTDLSGFCQGHEPVIDTGMKMSN